ncbi:hypothetical protein AVEN_72423-1, partial [Araneus ventricosus]
MYHVYFTGIRKRRHLPYSNVKNRRVKCIFDWFGTPKIVTRKKREKEDVISDFLEDLPLSDLRNVWFQHVAPPHKVSSAQQYIQNTFQQQVIGYDGCVEWSTRSPDLNPLDFFLWGYFKQRVYATPPPTLQELRNRITDPCASASPAMLYNVQREVQSRSRCVLLLKDTILSMTLISGKCSFVQRDQTN